MNSLDHSNHDPDLNTFNQNTNQKANNADGIVGLPDPNDEEEYKFGGARYNAQNLRSNTMVRKGGNKQNKDDPPTPPVEDIDFGMDGRDRKNTADIQNDNFMGYNTGA